MRRLAVLALLLQAPPAASSPRLRDCPNCAPVPVVGSLPWFRATTVAADGAIGFAVSNSPRFKNRPLYSGAWDGGLVLSGDRPVTHLADDAAIYGGLLLGLRRGPRGGGGGGGGAAVWLHNFSAIDSSFAGGAVRWSARDDGGPLAGLSVRAAVYAAADGVGFVLDANVAVELLQTALAKRRRAAPSAGPTTR